MANDARNGRPQVDRGDLPDRTDPSNWLNNLPFGNYDAASRSGRLGKSEADDFLASLMANRENRAGSANDNQAYYDALNQTMLQRLYDLEARRYNSVNEQVERLMQAGMSRTQALLTATAGEATPSTTADFATATASDRQANIQKWTTGLQYAGNTLSFLVGNYGSLFQMAGDALVQPIGEEIYSWLPRGIHVPDRARADAQSFKEWCLGELSDGKGGFYEAPQEAQDLIRSKAWARMASRPSGWLAFEKYFNANYSTRGYHEDYDDAERKRAMERADLVTARMDAVIKSPAFTTASLEQVNDSLRGVQIDLSQLALNEQGNSVFFTNSHTPDFTLAYDPNDNSTSVHEKGVNPLYNRKNLANLVGFFIEDDGKFKTDAAQRLQGLAYAFNEEFQTLKYLGSASHISKKIDSIVNDDNLKLTMQELDLICQNYQRGALTKAEQTISGADGAQKWFYEVAQQLLSQYYLLTGGRNFIGDASNGIGGLFDMYNMRHPIKPK